MKTKRLYWVLAVIVCAAALLFGLKLCSEEQDESVIFTYIANGNVSASGDDAFSSLACIPDYTEAITDVLGDKYSMTEIDEDVISSCDAVFTAHRTNHPTWEGTVEIEKSKIGPSSKVLSKEVIKTYKYE